MTKPLFLDRLLSSDDRFLNHNIIEFIDSPSVEGLRALLTPYVNLVPDPLWDNHAPESALQLVCTLMFQNLIGASHHVEFKVDRVNGEFVENGKKKERSTGYVDVWLHSLESNNAVMIELKRIRPNALIIPTVDSAVTANVDWYPENFTKVFNELAKYAEREETLPEPAKKDTLRGLRLHKDRKKLYMNGKYVPESVADVEEKAMEQVKEYELPRSSVVPVSVARFTVVQVGKPLLIKKVS